MPSVFIKALEEQKTKTHISSFGRVSEEQRALHGFAQQGLAEAESKPTKLAVEPPEFFHLQAWEQADEWGEVTNSTWSAQTAVDLCVLPALWALWNCKADSTLSSRDRKPWVTKDVCAQAHKCGNVYSPYVTQIINTQVFNKSFTLVSDMMHFITRMKWSSERIWRIFSTERITSPLARRSN